MTSKINFLYGRDYYNLKQYAKSLYSDKSLTWQSFDCSDDVECDNFIASVATSGLFGATSHFYAYNIFDNVSKIHEKLQYIANSEHPIILAHSQAKEQLDKEQKALFKKIIEIETITKNEFEFPDKKELTKMAQARAGELDCKFQIFALQNLLESLEIQDEKTRKPYIDTMTLVNYAKQIALFVKSQNRSEITSDDVALFAPKLLVGIFKCLDAIVARDISLATKFVSNFIYDQDGGEALFYMLSSQIRNLFIIKSMLEVKKTAQDINAQLKLHPYVLQKSVQVVQKYTLTELKNIYLKLINADLDIRNGTNTHEKAVWSLVFA